MNASNDPADRDLVLTAYNEDLGFVTERRHMHLPAGRSRIEVADVPARIDPTSVCFAAGESGVRLIEQNFQYDLASAGTILQRFLDHAIEAVLKEGEIKRGVLLSYDDQSLVLRGDGGEISLVQRAEVVDVRLPSLPDGLRSRPTLLWLVESDEVRDAIQEFSYLTGGIAWRAEYVAVVSDDDSEIGLAGWITLGNQSGAAFSEARLRLLAGDVHRVGPQPLGREETLAMSLGLGRMSLGKGVREEALFEFHLYALDQRVTISNCETKQVALFPRTQVTVSKSYRYEGGHHSHHVRVLMEMQNRADRGLGMPLPAGRIRIYKRDSDGQLHFIGEDMVEHTAQNEKIKLVLGTAFDLVGERTVVTSQRLSKEEAAEEIVVRIRNRKTHPVEVTVRETLWSHWRIMRSTHDHTPRDASSIDFLLTVPADGEEVLTYSYRHGVR